MVGSLAAKDDLSPGMESSNTIDLLNFMPLKFIAFMYGEGFGLYYLTFSLGTPMDEAVSLFRLHERKLGAESLSATLQSPNSSLFRYYRRGNTNYNMAPLSCILVSLVLHSLVVGQS